MRRFFAFFPVFSSDGWAHVSLYCKGCIVFSLLGRSVSFFHPFGGNGCDQTPSVMRKNNRLHAIIGLRNTVGEKPISDERTVRDAGHDRVCSTNPLSKPWDAFYWESQRRCNHTFEWCEEPAIKRIIRINISKKNRLFTER